MKFLSGLLCAALSLSALAPQASTSAMSNEISTSTAISNVPLSITTKNNDPQEIALKARLTSLIEKYQLEKWLYTHHIVIDKEVHPSHSHPVLTLGLDEKLMTDDLDLVSALLHEEFHWNMVMNSKFMPDETTAMVKAKFPGLDPNFPNGSGNENSTYGHVLVCYMEYKATAGIFGEQRTAEEFKSRPYYKAVYAIVVDKNNHAGIEEMLARAGVHI